MADFPSTPQAFTFRGRELVGKLVGFNGDSPRRFTSHEYIKRRGAKVEDNQGGPRRLDVRLVFTGANCARDYADFEQFVDENPRGLLIHPIAGRWQAFCAGPKPSVEFARATDEIQVTVSFHEDELDAVTTVDLPDVATASQNATGERTNFQTAVARFLGELGKAQTAQAQSLATLDAALDQVDVLTAPVSFVSDSITSALGARSAVIGKVLGISTKTTLLVQQVTDYLDVTSDLFDGADVSAGAATSVATLLGVVQESAQELVDLLLEATHTPAACADAVGAVEEMVAACLILDAAIKAARPPTILYVVPELTDVVTLAQRRYKRDAMARASEILNLNRIPNPAAIPAGTELLIPSR